MEHSKKSTFPAKAGIHLSGDGAVEEWVPAFAGNALFWNNVPEQDVRHSAERFGYYSPAPGPGRGLVVPPAASLESSTTARCCSSCSNSLDTIRQEATSCFPVDSTKALTMKNRAKRAVASSCSCASAAAARIRSRISWPA